MKITPAVLERALADEAFVVVNGKLHEVVEEEVEIGDLEFKGLSVTDYTKKLAQRLKPYIKEPHVVGGIEEETYAGGNRLIIKTKLSVGVIGDVAKPASIREYLEASITLPKKQGRGGPSRHICEDMFDVMLGFHIRAWVRKDGGALPSVPKKLTEYRLTYPKFYEALHKRVESSVVKVLKTGRV